MALARVNAYKCAKFQVPSFISYGDMEGVHLPSRPLAVKFLYVDIVPANACQHTKFQLSSSISFGNMGGGSQNKNWELLISPDVP